MTIPKFNSEAYLNEMVATVIPAELWPKPPLNHVPPAAATAPGSLTPQVLYDIENNKFHMSPYKDYLPEHMIINKKNTVFTIYVYLTNATDKDFFLNSVRVVDEEKVETVLNNITAEYSALFDKKVINGYFIPIIQMKPDETLSTWDVIYNYKNWHESKIMLNKTNGPAQYKKELAKKKGKIV